MTYVHAVVGRVWSVARPHMVTQGGPRRLREQRRRRLRWRCVLRWMRIVVVYIMV